MKQFVTLLALTLALLAPQARAQSLNLATVDMKKVFDGYWKTKQADLNLKERAKELEQRRKEMLEDFKNAEQTYKQLLDSANDKAVSMIERDKRKASAEAKLREIREIEQSVQQFDRSSRAELGETQRNMRDKIVKEIRETLDSKALAEGYHAVLDSSGVGMRGVPFLLYSKGLKDITDELIAQLNAGDPTARATIPNP